MCACVCMCVCVCVCVSLTLYRGKCFTVSEGEESNAVSEYKWALLGKEMKRDKGGEKEEKCGKEGGHDSHDQLTDSLLT